MTQRPDYLHAEFASATFGFVDDVEFHLAAAGRIDVRSASRLGYSDFGVKPRPRRGAARQLRSAEHRPAAMNPLESWQEEQRSAFLYRVCAEAETGNPRAELFQRLAGEAEAQAAIWRAQLTARGHAAPPPFVPDLRTRMVAALVRAIGPRPLRGILAAMKVRGMAVYSSAAPIEPGHAGPRPGGGIEHRHRGLGSGGNLRAAVFGVNDGLVSNASLILGVAGASADPQRRAADRRRRHVRRRVRDGGRRIRLGALAARAVRVPDRPRARRARASIPRPRRRSWR